MKVTALAITHNEAENLQRFITEMSFADELIIVDSFSTDKTLDIAKANNAIVVQRKFKNFSDQKNHAISLASNDWIVFFDPDERLSKDLIDEIKSVLKDPSDYKAFEIKRRFYFMGKHLKYSGFQNDKAIRIFDKNFCQYNGNLVHEILEVEGKVCALNHSLDHYSYKGFDTFNTKLTQYAELQAEQLYQQNKKPNLYHFLIRPLYRFIHQYVVKLGALDGKEGFVLAYLQGFSVFKRYIILWTKYRNIT